MNTKSLIIKPTTLSFITTNKCTASCENCCFGCNPQNKDTLSLNDMKKYIDQTIEAYSTVKLLVLTGGECFTLRKDLLEIISYASQKNMITRVVTNAYWATSLEKAYLKLKKLVDRGLYEINISTGDEHQGWVPYDNVVYAIIAALKLNLTVAVNVESDTFSTFTSKQIREDLRLKEYFEKTGDKLLVMDSLWMPFKKSKLNQEKSVENEKVGKSYILHKRCQNLFNTISINPFHRINACCGLTSEYIPYLYLGNTKKHSIKQIYEHQFNDLLKIWLYTEGPQKILDFVNKKMNIQNSKTDSKHMCQLCAELFNDDEKIKFLQQHSDSVLSNILLKYTLIKGN